MTNAKKIVVTGASGFLGWNLCRLLLQKGHAVTAVAHRHAIRLEGVIDERCDLTDYAGIRDLLHRHRPDAIVHAAAVASPAVCQEHPAESRKVNVDASIAIAGLCQELAIPCAFVSTDLVFDGREPPYDEEKTVSPISRYGEQKAEAEAAMVARHDRVTVCRMPLMYGDAPAPAQSFLQPLIQGILSGKEQRLFTDEYRTPASGADAAAGIALVLFAGEKIVHLGGRESVSRFEFARSLAYLLGRKDANLRPLLQADMPAIAPRPKNVSLDSRKSYLLGYDPAPIESALGRLACVREAIDRLKNE
jgi:dTDP-4-dehydrorhamnose reductase